MMIMMMIQKYVEDKIYKPGIWIRSKSCFVLAWTGTHLAPVQLYDYYHPDDYNNNNDDDDDDDGDDDDDDENENKPNCCRNPIARLLSVYNYLMDGRVKFPWWGS